MKKVLLGTTALVAATLVAAPGAQASEKIKLQLGGFFGQVIGWADQDDDFENKLVVGGTAAGANVNTGSYKSFDQKSASEIHVKGETKLDNGITVGMRVEFETDSFNGDNGTNGGRAFDESFMYLSSATLGRLDLGATKGPAWSMGHRAPNASIIGLNAGDISVSTVYLALPGQHSARGDMATTGANDASDFNRINYISPRFMGVGIGLSYVPDSGYANNAAVDKTVAGFSGSYYSAALAYDDTLFGVKVGADFNMARRGADNVAIAAGTIMPNSTTWYGGGLNFGYAGFTLGGSFSRQIQDSEKAGNTANVRTIDGHKWDTGLTYETGPYKVGLTYTKGETAGRIDQGGEDTYSEWVLGFNYNLGPGVDFNAALFRGNYDNEVGGGSAAGNENDGYGLQAGVLLTF
ncbi:MAG: porin [Magnetospirillum sp. WYHS-4]